MKRIPLLLLCVLPLVASATIYRYVDQNGNVVFSDHPKPGSKVVKLPPISTYHLLPPQGATANGHKPHAQAAYTHFSIAVPGDHATIRSNTGTVQVTFELQPGLRPGDHIVLNLDGNAYGGSLTGTQTTLHNVNRGTHTLQGQVVNAQGTVLTSTQVVTFYLHRASRLMPHG